MQTYRSCENIPTCRRSVALGLFDGLHPAHRRVILAATMGIDDDTIVSVYTFDPATVHTKAISGLLCDQQEEEYLLDLMGVDELFRVDFPPFSTSLPKISYIRFSKRSWAPSRCPAATTTASATAVRGIPPC